MPHNTKKEKGKRKKSRSARTRGGIKQTGKSETTLARTSEFQRQSIFTPGPRTVGETMRELRNRER